MIISENASLERLAIHKTGNKSREEGVKLSTSCVMISERIRELLMHYFLQPFKSPEYFQLFHETDLSLNEVYHYVCSIFDDPESFFAQSHNLALHLYQASSHPKIKPGEFYVVHFKQLIVDGEETEAIGLFKSELKETFLKVYPSGDNFMVGHEDGININKLDKGCIIFNLEREKGFVVAAIDNTSKSNEAIYWMDTFLNLRQRADDYYFTNQTMQVCREFVTDKLPEIFEIDRPGQAELLNKSIKFFKENEAFDLDDFAGEVFGNPVVIETFREYKRDYEVEKQVELSDSFDISGQAVRRQSKVFKSILKLDKNFHVYIHGNRDLIEKGFDDERNLHYYRLFFKEEN